MLIPRKLYFFTYFVYFLCVAFTKVAILSLYLRINPDRHFRWTVWACMGIVIASCIASVFAALLQCTPVRKAWDIAGTLPGSCINVNALFFANAGLDIFQDTMIYLLPMRMLYHLQIPKRQKIALIVLFALGGFVILTGMVRLTSLKKAQNTLDPSCALHQTPKSIG